MKETSVNGCCWGILFTFLLSVGNILLGGFIFSTLWGWFVVPLGLAAIHIYHSWGLMILLSFLSLPILMAIASVQDKLPKENGSFDKFGIVVSVATTFIYLLFWLSGWIAYSAMAAFPTF